ncbi:zinc dependent phospholipase C family protein [Thermohalobacter berrensis]|uniref:Phospholipase C/D domain-containing protein n=1 Tax=Thermohalobacter berrensis TaxID=99594 RepID=A0A419SU17_9FIRM|nr:zinc dependent phospholipase C family protein [Thermohalobacter berrensis]RKD28773.1 hypothetical protein BET03_06965 [Thermohalobacter berrensis]
MLINTHKLISSFIYDFIRVETNIEIDKNYFKYGNMKPDFTYGLFNRSHTLKDSFGFVIEKANNLISSKDITTKQFSSELGVICHFTSDFFCTPHYYKDGEYSKLLDHINYEYNLHNKLKEVDKKFFLDFYKKRINNIKTNSIGEIILLLNENYSRIRPNMDNDIYFAIMASSLVSKLVVENAYLFTDKKIAA